MSTPQKKSMIAIVVLAVLLILAVAAIPIVFFIDKDSDSASGNPTQLSAPAPSLLGTMLLWDNVAGASSYSVMAAGKAYSAAGSFFDLSSFKDSAEYLLQVKAIGDGDRYSDSQWSHAVSYRPASAEKLQAPDDLRHNGTTILWEYVEGAERYLVRIGEDATPTENTFLELNHLKEPGVYHIQVKAIGDGVYFTDSNWTEVLEYYVEEETLPQQTVLDRPSGVELMGNTVLWQYVKNSSNYNVRITNQNNESDQVTHVTGNTFFHLNELSLPEGRYYIQIKAIGDTVLFTDSEWSNRLSYINESETEPTDSLIFNFNAEKNYYSVTGSAETRSLTEIVIPSTYSGYAVKEIEASAFMAHGALTKIVIPSSIEIIGDYAFRGLPNLQTVSPINADIGISAFENCVSLMSLNVTAKLIGEKAFYGCEKLTNLTLENVESIGNSAFALNPSLKSLQVSGPTTSIGTTILYGAGALESLSIPLIGKTPYSDAGPLGYFFGEAAFEGAEATIQHYTSSSYATKTYYIPSSLTKISVTGATTLPHGAFENCIYLEEVLLCDTIKTFNTYTFQNCIALTELRLPASLTNTGTYAFYGCTSLTNITLPDALEQIGDYAFYECVELTPFALPDTLITIGPYAFYACKKWTEFVIPASVKTINVYAFAMTGLTRIEIPATVTTIGAYIFSGCEMQEIILPYFGTTTATNRTIGSLFSVESSNVEYSDYKDLQQRTASNTYTTYRIPTSLKRVVVTHATVIPFGAFQGMDWLSDIVLCDTIKEINMYAFKDCTALTELNLTDALTTVGNYAFQNCTSLAIPALSKNLKTIGQSAFESSGIQTAVFYESLTDLNLYAFRYCTDLRVVDFSRATNLSALGYHVFYGCTNLEEAQLSPTFIQVPTATFENCINLKEIVIPANVTRIYATAFKNTGLQKVYIANDTGLVTVSKDSFSDCADLEAIFLPSDEMIALYQANANWEPYLDLLQVGTAPSTEPASIHAVPEAILPNNKQD